LSLERGDRGGHPRSHAIWVVAPHWPRWIEDDLCRGVLRRTLSVSEQAVLHQRLMALGADRLRDIVIDLDAVGLGTWLADPAAS
jgi:hypothetical protein